MINFGWFLSERILPLIIGGREIIEDFTQTDSWEKLEETVTNVLRKFYNKEVYNEK